MNVNTMKRTTIVLSVIMFVSLGSAQQANITQEGPMPGDFTHPLEDFSQRYQLTLASVPVIGSQSKVAEVRTKIAEDRLAESQEFINSNRTEKGLQLAQQYRNQMEKAMESAEKANMTDVSQRLENRTRKHVEVLKGLQDRVSEKGLTGIQTALGNAQENLQKFEVMGNGQKPGNAGGKPSDIGGP